MRILEKGYSYKQRCCECNALLLVEKSDIKIGTYTDYDGSKEQYEIFYCPVCGSSNNVKRSCKISYPNHEISKDELEKVLKLGF